MIICTRCGHDNDRNDKFCGSCGAFLEWLGESVEEEPEPQPEPEAEPELEPIKPGLVQRVRDALVADDDSASVGPPLGAAVPADDTAVGASAAEAEREEAAREVDEQAARQQAAREQAEREDAEARRRNEEEARKAALVATPKVEETSSAPHAAGVAPTEARQRPPPTTQHRAPTRQPKPGDLICGRCGESNDPNRNFCRRCGETLAEAVEVKVAWWRGLRRRPREPAAAGERPGRARGSRGASGTRGGVRGAKGGVRKVRSTVGKFRKVMLILMLLGVAVAFAGPLRGKVGDAYDSVRRTISPSYQPVRPVSASAPSVGGHDATLLIDQVKNTYWSEGAAGPGDAVIITVEFSEPTDLHKFGITPGASGGPEDFVAQPRPRDLHLVFHGTEATSTDITVRDEAKFQSFDIGGKQVTTVEIQVNSVYQSIAGDAMSIAELEFFRKE